MASPLGRLIAQLVVVGTSVISKAFMQAYQQAVANAGRQGGAKAAAASLQQSLSRTIKLDEARMVLNVSETATKAEIEQTYKRLFDANEVGNGGSFYLQSKIYRSRGRIIEEMEKHATDAQQPPSSSSPSL